MAIPRNRNPYGFRYKLSPARSGIRKDSDHTYVLTSSLYGDMPLRYSMM